MGCPINPTFLLLHEERQDDHKSKTSTAGPTKLVGVVFCFRNETLLIGDNDVLIDEVQGPWLLLELREKYKGTKLLLQSDVCDRRNTNQLSEGE